MTKYEIHEAGTSTLSSSNSTKAVTFAKPFTSGVTPVIVMTPQHQSSFWLTNISNTGFTANFGTPDVSYDRLFDWVALRAVSVV